PTTMFPGAWITRPWDVAPLLIYILAGFFIFPSFYLKYPSLFSHALIISTISNAITQLHMAFGSSALFDNHFNIAHFLKIIAYVVPLAGLIFDYARTNQKVQLKNRQLNQTINEQEKTEQALRQSEVLLKDKNQELAETLQELQHTQSQLIHTEKMSSLGDLVGGIAHEINNPANFIYGNLMHADSYTNDLLNLIQLYQTEYPQPTAAITEEIEAVDLEFIRGDLPKMLASMKSGADRIRAIVLSLRNFARLDEAELKEVNLHDGIDGALMILNHRLIKGITVIKNYGDLPLIECYPSQLNQAWLNIIENAIDAFSENNSSSPQLTITSEMINNNLVRIAIADNGKGIPENIQSKIFNPFFTTKPVGKGTGLGLSVCYQVINQHGGLIAIDSQPQKGTTVTVTLPQQPPL
ncbi:MAG: ATP-binding protein, partial [Jaaginema sp. PMC 1079.18]|nr:ATP-binding protein [Jaaginema sp. PMC 1079.18]